MARVFSRSPGLAANVILPASVNRTMPAAHPSPGPETVVLTVKGRRWCVRQDLAVSELKPVFDDPDRFLRDPSQLVADSTLITLGKIPPARPGAPTLLLRRLNYRRWRHRARDIFRATRAERALRHGLELEAAGIHTPRHLAAGVKRCWRWPLRAYLLTEWVPDAISLEAWLQQHGGLSREHLYRIADLLARLHNHNFSHRDLKASNLLFDAALRPCLIDLDGVRHYPRLSEARAAADLTRLAWEFVRYPKWLARNGRRFLARYGEQRGLPRELAAWEQAISEPIVSRLQAGKTRWK